MCTARVKLVRWLVSTGQSISIKSSAIQDLFINKLNVIPAEDHGINVQELCSSATEVVKQLQQSGHEAYIVGGSVRDLLLGKNPKDFDIATGATPEQVKEVFPRCRLIGRRFRLAHVRIRGELLEVATFRGQSESERGSKVHEDGRILRDNVWGSLEEDAIRRDFTINALFMDPVSGDIKDFVGGYEDLQEKRLRLIGDPEARYREDPVRMLRAARFVAKLGVQLDQSTRAPIAELAPGLEQIPAARLFEEVLKLFLTGHAQRTLTTLQELGLTRFLFPVMPGTDTPGVVALDPVVNLAMESTDRRIAQGKSVTPAFLFAALFWQPLEELAEKYRGQTGTRFQAYERAAEEVILSQVQRTAIPRRFSTVTRQIWMNQLRLERTQGRRALRILTQPRFRASYDFLLLRAENDPELKPLVEFWTEEQKGVEFPESKPRPPRRRRRPRRRKPKNTGGQ